MDKNKLEQLIEATINSVDGAERATPAPFLLTRINARMLAAKEESNSIWERASSFLSRPGFALATLAFIIVLNILLYSFKDGSGNFNNALQNLQASADENPMGNASALFDLENFQP